MGIWKNSISNGKTMMTPEGGIAIRLKNKTGADSVKGCLVNTNAGEEGSFQIAGADDYDIIGAVYESGIPDGEMCIVVLSGIAQVLLQDTTASTIGYWAKISDTVAGRADISNIKPEGGTVQEIDNHFREIGHSLETKAAGTDVLAKIIMHFN